MSFAPVSFKVGATLAAYIIVKASAGDTVNKATAATDKLLGITADDVENTNEAIPVMVSGIAKLQFNDTCAVGGFVTADANGYGVPVSVTTAGVYSIGQLVGPAVSATGTIAEVLIQPMQLQIP
jgi:hypothetical protein